MAHRHQFIQRHAGHCGTQGFQPLDRLSLSIAPHSVFGDQPGNRPAMPVIMMLSPRSISSRSWANGFLPRKLEFHA
jgi:hypothetical protein